MNKHEDSNIMNCDTILNHDTICLRQLSLVRVPEVLQEVRNLVTEHVIDSLNHFRPQLFKFVNAISIQDPSLK